MLLQYSVNLKHSVSVARFVDIIWVILVVALTNVVAIVAADVETSVAKVVSCAVVDLVVALVGIIWVKFAVALTTVVATVAAAVETLPTNVDISAVVVGNVGVVLSVVTIVVAVVVETLVINVVKGAFAVRTDLPKEFP